VRFLRYRSGRTNRHTHHSTSHPSLSNKTNIEFELMTHFMPVGCGLFWTVLHCKKYPYIRGYFVASFPYFNGTGSVYVCIGKSTEQRSASPHCNVENSPQDVRGYTGTSFTVYGRCVHVHDGHTRYCVAPCRSVLICGTHDGGQTVPLTPPPARVK